MYCSQCDKELTPHIESYHYTACGLDNIFLEGVEVYRCGCGEKIVSIPVMPALHTVIGSDIVSKKTMLSGAEIRFLRKNMGLNAKALASIMSVDNATISRWENGKAFISPPNDRLLRLVYIDIAVPQEKRQSVARSFAEILTEYLEPENIIIPISEVLKGRTACQIA